MSDGYKAVQRWTKEHDVLQDRLLLFPIHLETHWCLASVCPGKQQIVYYDSLQGYSTTCMRNLYQYMQCVSAGLEHSDSQWTCSPFTSTPEQLNSSDCGVFVCAMARCLAANHPLRFTQDDISDFRKRIVFELLSQKLLP